MKTFKGARPCRATGGMASVKFQTRSALAGHGVQIHYLHGMWDGLAWGESVSFRSLWAYTPHITPLICTVAVADSQTHHQKHILTCFANFIFSWGSVGLSLYDNKFETIFCFNFKSTQVICPPKIFKCITFDSYNVIFKCQFNILCGPASSWKHPVN